MIRKVRALLRDVFLKLPLSGTIQRAVWRRRQKRRERKQRLKCALVRRVGPEVIRHVHETLSSIGVRYMIDYGTLLGCIREHGFVKNDDDFDLAVPDQGLNAREFLLQMEQAGFKYRHHFEYDERVIEFCFEYLGATIDFFLNTEDRGLSRSFVCVREMDRSYPAQNASTCYWNRRPLLDGITTVEFLGANVCAPRNCEEVLAASYGDDWKTPIQGLKVYTRRMDKELRGEMPGYSYVYNDRNRLLSK